MKASSFFLIEENALRGMLTAFYLILAVIDLVSFSWLLTPQTLPASNWLWPAAWIDLLPQSVAPFAFPLLTVCTLAVHMTCALIPYSRSLKIMAFVSFLILVAIKNSFGKIDHNLHGVLYVSFGLIFVSNPATCAPRSNRAALLLTQGLFLATYSASGLWKLRSMIATLSETPWRDFNPLAAHLQWNQMQSFQHPSPTLWSELPWLSHALWWSVIFFEILCLLSIFAPRWLRPVALGIIAMHTMIFWQMQISFWEAALMAALILYNHPFRTARS